jgi:hypothetical protein
VSLTDGRKYYRSARDYRLMQQESDALCREYGLSVIENPEKGRAKHYAEQEAERAGRPTWRGLVKSDVDAAIRQAVTERQFFENLRRQGYAIKVGKDISVRPPGKERFVRLQRNFGEDYAIERIRRRILAQSRAERQIIPPDPPPQKARIAGTIHKARKLTGLRALYFYYLYRMGVLPRKRARAPNPKRVYFLFREDIRHMQNIAREIRLMVRHGIDTTEQLAAHKEGAAAQIAALSDARKRLRNRARGIRDGNGQAALKSEIAALSEKIGALRREVNLCDGIERRSLRLREKLCAARADESAREKFKGKEVNRDEPFRRRR